MNVYIRTNFSSKIGLGHIKRVTRLALEMESKGINCIFVLDHIHPNNLENFEKIFLYRNTKKFSSEISDAKLFCKLTKNNKGHVLVDDYRLGRKWEQYVSNCHKKIIIFDDVEDKEHFADVIINYNPKHNPTIKYDFSKNKKSKCNYLINPKYNIISKQKIIKTNDFMKNKFYITFYIGGGNDPKIFYKLLINLAKNINNSRKVKLLVIVGPLSKNKNLITKLNKKYNCIETIVGSTDLYYVIKNTKIFIGTSGTAVFETAFLKTPSILFKMSKNQNTDIFSLEKIGHYFFVNSNDLYAAKKFMKLIFLIIKNYSRFQSFNKKPEIKIDNMGAERLINSIFFKSRTKKTNKKIKHKINTKFKKNLEIRLVKDKDINHYFYSRFLEANNEPISILDHYIWWFETNRKSYVLLKDGIKILYFYEEKLFSLNKYSYLLSGWFACVKNYTLKEILFTLNWQRNRKNKNVKWITCIQKNNYLNIKFNKRIGWKHMDKKNKIIKILTRKLKINPNNFIFQEN